MDTIIERNTRIFFILILCAAAVLRAYMVTLDMNILLDQGLVQDDAFYYYVIARNILEHSYSSFDGINLTNGYHPLWQAICLPVFYFWDGNVAVRVMLAIASCFDLLALFLFFKILLRVVKSEYVALIGVAILAFHGTIIRTWFNGLETAISIFSLLWLLHQFLHLKDNTSSAIREHAWFGFIAAFAFLARTDNAIIIVTLYAILYLPAFVKERDIKFSAAASFVLLMLIAPWLAWNLYHFGNVVQVSGLIRDNTWLVDSRRQPQPFYLEILYGIWGSFFPTKTVFQKMFSPGLSVPLSGYIYLAAMIFALGYAKKSSNQFRKSVFALLPFISGVILLFLYHVSIRHFIRGWYNAPMLLMLTLVLCLLLDILVSKFHRSKHEKIMLSFFCAVLLIFYSPYYYTKTPSDLTLDPRVAVAEWINQHTPEQTIVGAANAGIMGYYTKRSVINLDGVVNESAFHARLNNELHHYIHDANIQYLADHKGAMSYLCAENAFYSCTREGNFESSTMIMRVNHIQP